MKDILMGFVLGGVLAFGVVSYFKWQKGYEAQAFQEYKEITCKQDKDNGFYREEC